MQNQALPQHRHGRIITVHPSPLVSLEWCKCLYADNRPSGICAGGSTSGHDTSITDPSIFLLENASQMSLSSNPNTSLLARMTPLPSTSTAVLSLLTLGQRPFPHASGKVIVGSEGSAGSSTMLSMEGHQANVVHLSTISIPGTGTRKESFGRGMSTVSNPIPSALSVKTNSFV